MLLVDLSERLRCTVLLLVQSNKCYVTLGEGDVYARVILASENILRLLPGADDGRFGEVLIGTRLPTLTLDGCGCRKGQRRDVRLGQGSQHTKNLVLR